MKKRNIIQWILLSLAIIFVTAIAIIFYFVKRPALNGDQFVSVSTPPEMTEEDPHFHHCDSIPCSCNCDDPYDPRESFPRGEFTGMCASSCILRSVKKISTKEAIDKNYFLDSHQPIDYVYAVNVYHQSSDTTKPPGFYAAKIDLDGIKDIIFQFEFAGGIQGHAQMRISFDPNKPVLLISQQKGASREIISETELNYSVEALGPPGIPYKGDFGFRGEYRQAHRLVTQYSRAVRMIKDLHRPVLQYRINITADQKKAVVLQMLNQALKADPDERYHTTNNNCVLKLFEIIDNAAPPPFYRIPLLWITNNTLFIPRRVGQHLRYRGLIEKKSSPLNMVNLETELGWEECVQKDFVNITR